MYRWPRVWAILISTMQWAKICVGFPVLLRYVSTFSKKNHVWDTYKHTHSTVGQQPVRARLHRDCSLECQALHQGQFVWWSQSPPVLQRLSCQVGQWPIISDRKLHGWSLSSRGRCQNCGCRWPRGPVNSDEWLLFAVVLWPNRRG